ncbi:MAG: glycerol kinase, partial [Caulobacteraceae bacterium]|nr:glycerol kinase [Caulobacteraceae bacterium]
IAIKELRADGGMVANELLMQFQADMLGLPVVRPEVSETTALGAAYAAGLAVGVWPDLEEVSAHWKAHQRWTPNMPEARRASLYASWKKAVGRSFDWAI